MCTVRKLYCVYAFKKESLRKEWIRRILSDLTITKNTVVCIKHFHEESNVSNFFNESSQSCLCTNSPELTMKISMCSVNVCGLNSKLITILQDYMKQFDANTKNTNMGVFMAYACL